MAEWGTSSPEATEQIGRQLFDRLRPDGILLLHGELAAGKTVLTRGLAQAMGISPEAVQSPSYTLIHEHEGAEGALVHVDLYRLSPEEALGLGLEEVLERPAIKVVEWPERLPFAIPEALELTIEILPGGGRRLVLHPEHDHPTTRIEESV